jgi:hypothetical protein
MMKFISLNFAVAVSLLLCGCGFSIARTETVSIQTNTQTGVQQTSKIPKVYELQVDAVANNSKERQELRFVLSVGDRIEGEISTSSNSVLSTVYDPYGNVTTESARTTWVDVFGTGSDTHNRQRISSNQKYPWKFAFIAAISGEYILTVETHYLEILTAKPSAHLKIVVN